MPTQLAAAGCILFPASAFSAHAVGTPGPSAAPAVAPASRTFRSVATQTALKLATSPSGIASEIERIQAAPLHEREFGLPGGLQH